MVGVHSCFAVGSGEYSRFIQPGRFQVDIKLYREGSCVFILGVCPIELVRYEPAVYMSTELFGCESFRFPLVNVIDGVVGEVFMLVYCYDNEWCGSGTLR